MVKSRLAWHKKDESVRVIILKNEYVCVYSFFPVAKQTVKRQKAELEAITSKLADMETLVSSKV